VEERQAKSAVSAVYALKLATCTGLRLSDGGHVRQIGILGLAARTAGDSSCWRHEVCCSDSHGTSSARTCSDFSQGGASTGDKKTSNAREIRADEKRHNRDTPLLKLSVFLLDTLNLINKVTAAARELSQPVRDRAESGSLPAAGVESLARDGRGANATSEPGARSPASSIPSSPASSFPSRPQ